VPQKKAAFKAIKVSKKRHIRNQSTISELKAMIRKFDALIESKDAQKVKPALSTLIKKINKAKSKGVIHKKTASRKLSRIMKKAAKLK